MKINKKKVASTLALIGLTLGTSVSAAEVMRKPPRFESLTASQQSTLEEAHELHMLGKDDEARKLIEDAGIETLGFRGMKERGERGEHREQGEERMERFKTLIEQDDFESFQKMVAGTPMADIINTEEKFEALVQAHELRLEDKHDEAKEVLEDAGIKPFGRKVRNLK
jgi:hypothetical protein